MRKSVRFRLYEQILSTYLARGGQEGSSAYCRVVENVIRYADLGMMRWYGIQFPRRAIGGWMWTWRWRFEILTRWNEYESVNWCRQLIRPGMTVIDIGAHVGYYTRLFSELVGPSGKVFAFEPQPENFAVVKENLKRRRYRNVEIFDLAVSDRCGKAQLHVSPGSSNHSLLPGYTEEQGLIEVETVTLDEFLNKREVSEVGFVKVDVEGAEPLVLRGMPRILRSSQMTMLMEFNPIALRCGSTTPLDLLNLLENFGFQAEVINSDGSLFPARRYASDETVNLLCRKISATGNQRAEEGQA